MVLPDHVLEPLRPISPGDDGVRLASPSARIGDGGRRLGPGSLERSVRPATSGALGALDLVDPGLWASLARFIVPNPES